MSLLIASPYETWSCFTWLCLDCDFCLTVKGLRQKANKFTWFFGSHSSCFGQKTTRWREIRRSFSRLPPSTAYGLCWYFPWGATGFMGKSMYGFQRRRLLGSTTSGQKHHMPWGEGWSNFAGFSCLICMGQWPCSQPSNPVVGRVPSSFIHPFGWTMWFGSSLASECKMCSQPLAPPWLLGVCHEAGIVHWHMDFLGCFFTRRTLSHVPWHGTSMRDQLLALFPFLFGGQPTSIPRPIYTPQETYVYGQTYEVANFTPRPPPEHFLQHEACGTLLKNASSILCVENLIVLSYIIPAFVTCQALGGRWIFLWLTWTGPKNSHHIHHCRASSQEIDSFHQRKPKTHRQQLLVVQVCLVILFRDIIQRQHEWKMGQGFKAEGEWKCAISENPTSSSTFKWNPPHPPTCT